MHDSQQALPGTPSISQCVLLYVVYVTNDNQRNVSEDAQTPANKICMPRILYRLSERKCH